MAQLVDVAGQVRLWCRALERLRQSGRMVAVIVGATVLAWTMSQTIRFVTDTQGQGRTDLQLLSRVRSLPELAFEQGELAALTPVRDLYGLGDNLLLLLLATAILFRALTDRFDPIGPERLALAGPGSGGRLASPNWLNLIWGVTAAYFLYRLSALFAGTGDLPMGGCLVLEAIVVPVLMLLSDAALLAWVLIELRSAELGDAEGDRFEPRGVIDLLPGAALACLAGLPGRYLASAAVLGLPYLPRALSSTTWVGRSFRWLLLRGGLVEVQSLALAGLGLAGAVAWSRGSLRSGLKGYRRLLVNEGGRWVPCC